MQSVWLSLAFCSFKTRQTGALAALVTLFETGPALKDSAAEVKINGQVAHQQVNTSCARLFKLLHDVCTGPFSPAKLLFELAFGR
jgi:hypothetical protein